MPDFHISTTSTSRDTPFLSGILPSLDGWRAVSVCMVLFAHAHPPGRIGAFASFCGGTGVRYFFVISGFLITWLLLREATHSGRVDLKSFYVRRAFRILPVYYAFLIVYWILDLHSDQKLSQAQWMANLTLTANYGPALGASGHLWSLGVEEQFYLLWPCLFAMIRPHEHFRTAVWILASICVLCPILRGVSYLIGSGSFPILLHRFSFLKHADLLAIGCLGACLTWRFPQLWQIVKRYHRSIFLSGLALSLIMYPALNVRGFSLVSLPLLSTAQGFGFMMMLLSTLIQQETAAYRALNWGPVAGLGTLSYSLYIWHYMFSPPIDSWPRFFGNSLNSFPLWLMISLGISIASYYLLEQPLLKFRKRFNTHK